MTWKLLAALQKVSFGTNARPPDTASRTGWRPWRMQSVCPKVGRTGVHTARASPSRAPRGVSASGGAGWLAAPRTVVEAHAAVDQGNEHVEQRHALGGLVQRGQGRGAHVLDQLRNHPARASAPAACARDRA